MDSRPPGRAFRVVRVLMLGVFLASAAVQVNDPDPLLWVAVYLAGAVVGLLPPSWARVAGPAAAVVAGAWALWLLPRALSLRAAGDLMAEMKASRPDIEDAREALGLFLVAAWSGVVGVRAWREGAP